MRIYDISDVLKVNDNFGLRIPKFNTENYLYTIFYKKESYEKVECRRVLMCGEPGIMVIVFKEFENNESAIWLSQRAIDVLRVKLPLYIPGERITDQIFANEASDLGFNLGNSTGKMFQDITIFDFKECDRLLKNSIFPNGEMYKIYSIDTKKSKFEISYMGNHNKYLHEFGRNPKTVGVKSFNFHEVNSLKESYKFHDEFLRVLSDVEEKISEYYSELRKKKEGELVNNELKIKPKGKKVGLFSWLLRRN